MTKTTTVWRVQDDCGVGPFTSINAWGIESMWPIRYRLCTPQQDEGLQAQFNGAVVMGYNTLSAFKTLKQYEGCFNTREVRDGLHREGFYLARFEVDATAAWHGNTQSIFEQGKAKLVEIRACNYMDVPVKSVAANRLLKSNL